MSKKKPLSRAGGHAPKPAPAPAPGAAEEWDDDDIVAADAADEPPGSVPGPPTAAALGEATGAPQAGPVEGVIPPELAGQRMDTAVARLFAWTTYSRTFFQHLVDRGEVTLNGAQRARSHEVAAGDCVRVVFPPPEDPWPKPEALPIEILYEDDQVIVVNKAAGMVVHPAPGNPTGTLVNALLHHCRELSSVGGVKRPGIVHRLDRETSGLMVVAKTDRAHHSLGRQLANRTVSRRYIALAIGSLPQEQVRVDAPIGRDPNLRIRRAVHGEGARSAATNLRVLARKRFVTLVEASLESGRTHQIRVHLAHIGYPIAGDRLYGGAMAKLFERLMPAEAQWRGTLAPLDRPFLHAWKLTFNHPTRGGPMTFEAALPEPLDAIVTALFGTADLHELSDKPKQ